MSYKILVKLSTRDAAGEDMDRYFSVPKGEPIGDVWEGIANWCVNAHVMWPIEVELLETVEDWEDD